MCLYLSIAPAEQMPAATYGSFFFFFFFWLQFSSLVKAQFRSKAKCQYAFLPMGEAGRSHLAHRLKHSLTEENRIEKDLEKMDSCDRRYRRKASGGAVKFNRDKDRKVSLFGYMFKKV